MDWAEVLADPCLKDLPYKIELDQYGRIVMSPASNRHGRVQARLVRWLAQIFAEGEIVTECAIATPLGIKVADVIWASPGFVSRYGDATPLPEAPELCIEIVSPSNRAAAMAEKVALYLNAGAREVWLVREDGGLTLHGPEGERSASVLPVGVPVAVP